MSIILFDRWMRRLFQAETVGTYIGEIVMKVFLSVFLTLLLTASLYAEDYRMVGYIACNSLSKFDNKLIKFFTRLHSPLQKIPKGIQQLLWMSKQSDCHDKRIVDLVRNMDLEKPLGLYFMVPTSSDSGEAACVISVRRRGGKKHDTLNLLGTEFPAKSFHKMRYMSLNKDVLPSMEAVEEFPRIRSELKGKLICSEFIKKNPDTFKAFEKIFFEYFIEPVIPSENSQKFRKIVEKEISILRTLLEQTKEIVFDVDIKAEKLEIVVELTPDKGSELARFVVLQKKYRGYAPLVNAKKYLSLAGAVTPFSPYMKLACDLVSDISKISGSDNSKRFAEYVVSCINNGDGRFSYFVDSPACTFQGGQFMMSPLGMVEFQSKLKKDSVGKEYKGGLYCLNPDSTLKGKETLCCLSGKKSCLLANGAVPKLESRAVVKQLIERQVRPPHRSFLYALICEGRDEGFEIAASLSGKQNIQLDITISKPVICQIIPTKDSGKKGKKMENQKTNIHYKTLEKLFRKYY